MMDRGMARLMMNVGRQLRRKRKISRMASRPPCQALLTVFDVTCSIMSPWSMATWKTGLPGIGPLRAAISFLTAALAIWVLAPERLLTMR